MNKLSIIGFIIVVVGFIGMISTGCLSNEPTNITVIKDNVEEINNKQDAILKEMGIYQKQINNKLDEMMTRDRDQIDLMRSLGNEIKSLKNPTQSIMKVDISIDRGGYGEAASFNTTDEAINFIKGLK
jgi:hypothetical protein